MKRAALANALTVLPSIYQFMLKLFQRCLMKILNIDLWKCYITYVRETKSSLPNFRLLVLTADCFFPTLSICSNISCAFVHIVKDMNYGLIKCNYNYIKLCNNS